MSWSGKCIHQKQPPRSVPRKRYSENIQQIYRRILMPKCDFNKVPSNFIQITLRDRCSSVNFLHIFRTPFLKNTSGWLLLIHVLKIYILMVSNAKNLKVNGHVDIKTKSVFCLDVWHIQRCSENPVKHVRWSFFSCKKNISNFEGQYTTFSFNKNHQKYTNITP